MYGSQIAMDLERNGSSAPREGQPPGCQSVIFRCKAPQIDASDVSRGRAAACKELVLFCTQGKATSQLLKRRFPVRRTVN